MRFQASCTLSQVPRRNGPLPPRSANEPAVGVSCLCCLAWVAPLAGLSSARALTAAEARQRSTSMMRRLVLQRQLLRAGAESSPRLSLASSRGSTADPIKEELSRPELRLSFPCSGPRRPYWSGSFRAVGCPFALPARPSRVKRPQHSRRASLLVPAAEASGSQRLVLSLLILQPGMTARVKHCG